MPTELTTPQPPTVQNQVAKFIASLNAGFDAWVEAGTTLKAMVDGWGRERAFLAIRREYLIPESALYGFLRLGRKEIVPEVLASNEPWSRVVARLPYETQREVVDRRTLDIAVKSGRVDPRITLQRIRLEDLTERQCRQAITEDGRLLSYAQQRKQIEDEIRKSKPVNAHNWTPRDKSDRVAMNALNRELDKIARESDPVPAVAQTDGDEPDVFHYLSAAQQALLKVRELNGSTHQHDGLITACLQAIGKIRNSLKFR